MKSIQTSQLVIYDGHGVSLFDDYNNGVFDFIFYPMFVSSGSMPSLVTLVPRFLHLLSRLLLNLILIPSEIYTHMHGPEYIWMRKSGFIHSLDDVMSHYIVAGRGVHYVYQIPNYNH